MGSGSMGASMAHGKRENTSFPLIRFVQQQLSPMTPVIVIMLTIPKEELNRLDIFHKFFLVARENKLFSSPMGRTVRPKIMDLGTGTGIWAINVAEE